MRPKYPQVCVPLVGEDGNAVAMIGSVASALRRAGIPRGEIDAFVKDATSGDYDHVLQTIMNTVETT